MSVPISSAISATLASSAPNGLELDREARPLRELDECNVDGGPDLFREVLRLSGAGTMGDIGVRESDVEVDEVDLELGVRRGRGMGDGEK